MLDQETSKGLKLNGNYAALHRVGELGLSTDSFNGTQGYKTIVSLQAQNISGTFNPWGFFLRRWEIDSIHIQSGSVTLQKTEATPGGGEKPPGPPWWAFFWPDRVYLADVKADDAKILWNLKGKESGIYDTFLEITPNGRDFEYDAHGGVFSTPITPKLAVLHAHILVRKPRLYCGEFLFGDDPAHRENFLRVTGDAGLQQDRSMRLKIDLQGLKVAPWLPEKSRAHVAGQMSGHFDYSSAGTGLETGHGTGAISLANGVLHNLPQVAQYAALTGSPDPGDLPLKVCQADVHWDAGALSAQNIEVESPGVFRITGAINVAADKTLSGQIELGLTEPYLRWLPTAGTIFAREEGPYHFATIHFSGTTQKPIEDLSPRITHEVAKSPTLALKLFFNEAGQWFDFN